MRSSISRLARGVTGAVVATGLVACDLSTGPQVVENPIDLEIDFCANDVPIWFAYQNLGEPTTRVQPDAQGTFRFTATSRAVIGMVWQSGADYESEFIYASNEELVAISGRECQEEVGIKTVNGTIAGASAAQVAVVGLGVASVALTGGNTSYSLLNLPERPLDLVASRQNTDGLTRIADRIVLRRTQSFANNGTVPLVDFGTGGDAVAVATANAAVSGIFTSDFAFIQNNFFSQLGTSHSLFYSEDIGNGTH